MNTLYLRHLDRWLWPLAVRLGGLGASLVQPRRRAATPPLILRPGGMGDLILLCVAIEELGRDVREFVWLIEARSAPWARHLRLDFVCYDEVPLRTLWRLAGRHLVVVNTEQRYGLSQAASVLARSRGGRVFAFDTNVGAAWADQVVRYDPFEAHETVEFGRLVAAALGLERDVARPVRRRRMRATEGPVVGVGGLQRASRRLDEGRWLEIIHAWSSGRELNVSAAPADREFARRLCARLDGRAKLFEGDFEAVCDLIRRSSEVLTIDGGFMHIASYYGVPVTSVFTSSREKKWASLSPGSHIVRRNDLPCQPCALYAVVPPCPYGFACREVEFARDLR